MARKDGRFPGRGKRGSLNRPEQMLLDCIIKHYGGPLKLGKYCTERNTWSEDVFTKQDWINWRARGHVSIDYAHMIAKILGCSPFALAYKDLSRFYVIRERPSWEEAVRSCRFLSDAEIRRVLSSGKVGVVA